MIGRRLFTAGLMATGLAAIMASTAMAQDWPADMKKQPKEMVIGLSQLGSNVNGYVAGYVDAFQKYAKDWGVKIVVLDAQNDPAKQATDIRDLTSQHVDAMVVWPTNPKAIISSVKQAHDQGIPVIITNSAIDPQGEKYIVSFTGPNHFIEGQQAGELMAKGLNGKGNVVMIMGGPGYAATVARDQGFRDALKSHPDIKVLDLQYASWSREKAQSLMENFVTRFGTEIDGVYSMDAGMGIGALEGYKAAKSNGTLAADKNVIFTDATLFGEAYDAIKGGEYYGSVLQLPQPDAELALKTAILAAGGIKVEKVAYYETSKIDKDNIGQTERPNF